MDVNVIVQVIGSLGFPIAACCALFYYWNKEQESHKSEMELVTAALNRNTEVLTELKTIISTLIMERNNADNAEC